jgi:uncharacterized membrane protein
MATATPPPPSTLLQHLFDLRSTAGRTVASVLAGGLLAVVCKLAAPRWSLGVVAVGGWVAAGLSLLALSWWSIFTADASRTHHLAARIDPGRNEVWGLVLVASTFSLFAAGGVLRTARTVCRSYLECATLVGLCLIAVLTSWLLTHTAYALRYAHLYYRDDEEGVGGLDFPGKQAPDFLDFAYFAFTLGMCFQVSDVCISGRGMRRAALGHALLAFLYNTAILALALNLAFEVLR